MLLHTCVVPARTPTHNIFDVPSCSNKLREVRKSAGGRGNPLILGLVCVLLLLLLEGGLYQSDNDCNMKCSSVISNINVHSLTYIYKGKYQHCLNHLIIIYSKKSKQTKTNE